MPHDKKIWCELSRRTAIAYCPELTTATFGQYKCRDYLIPAICKRWGVKWSDLPGEQTFHNAIRRDSCGCVMKERWAILYYALIDPSVAAQMPQLLLALCDKERNIPTPYYNCFAEEFKNEKKKPHARLVLPEPYEVSLKEIPKTELEKLKEAIKKIEEEEK
jgi:hypothetical protein